MQSAWQYLVLLLSLWLIALPVGATERTWVPGDQHPLSDTPPVDADWQPMQGPALRQGNMNDGVWLRLINTEPDIDTIILRRGWWREMIVFVAMDDQWRQIALGYRHDNRGHIFSGRYIGSQLPDARDRDRPVYVWLQHDPYGTPHLEMVSSERYLAADFRYLRAIMLFFGVLLALTLYHLLIWIWLRQAAFGYYVLYLSMAGAFFLAQEGVLYQWNWRGWDFIGTPLINATASWTVGFACLFVRSFLDLHRYAPRFDRYLLLWPGVVLLAIGVLSLPASDSLFPVLARITALASLALTPVIIAAGILCWVRGNIAGAYVTVAWSLVVLAVSYRVLYGFGITPLDWITLYGTQAAVAVEAILLAIGLAHRLSIVRDERDQARQKLAIEHRLLMHGQMLNELARGLSSSRDADQVFSLTLAAIEKSMNTRFAVLIEQPGDTVVAKRGQPPEWLELPGHADQLKSLAGHHGWVYLSRPISDQRQLILLLIGDHLSLDSDIAADFLDLALPALNNVDYLSDIRHRAEHDALTGLLARGSFLDHARAVLTQGKHSNIAIAFMDLDHFKQINDRFGHAVGDEVLVEVCQRINACLREGDLIARYGGEEFVALLCGLDQSRAERLSERIRQSVTHTPCDTRVGPIDVSISIGLALANTPVELIEVIDQADHALYNAKRLGRDQVYIAP